MMAEIGAVLSGELGTWLRFAALLGVFLLGFWKALPAVLDAFERKQSGAELRMEALLDATEARFAKKLADADLRHDECVAENKRLRAEINELWGTINAMRQGVMSTGDVVARVIREAKEA